MQFLWHCQKAKRITGILQVLTLMTGFYSGSNFGPKNITRTAGANDEYIRCWTYSTNATPFWKINGIIYYYSEVPPPFVTLQDGREIVIPIIDLSLNGTSFQCFIPSLSRGGLISSSIGVLTVTEKDYSQVSRNNNSSQPKLIIAHKDLFFSHNSLNLAWRAINNIDCIYYQLNVRHGCEANSHSEVVVNGTKDNRIVKVFQHGLSSSLYFNITSYNGDGNLCEDLLLEEFQLHPGIVTESFQFCQADQSESCSPIPICINIPPLNGRQTLILALSAVSDLEEDLLCPVHPLPGERCVDLLSCNRFRESPYSNSITICRTTYNGSSLAMCLQNITENLRLHFFYSDLHCKSNGLRFKSTRIYAKSIQLQTTEIEDTLNVAINHSQFCISSECINQDCNVMFKISIMDKFSCAIYSSQNVTDDNCISFAMLQMNTACAPYYITVEAYNKTILYNRSIMEIQGYAGDSVLISSSKCSCYDGQSTTSTQSLAIVVCAIFGLIILILLIIIFAIAHKNYKMFSE